MKWKTRAIGNINLRMWCFVSPQKSTMVHVARQIAMFYVQSIHFVLACHLFYKSKQIQCVWHQKYLYIGTL